MPKHVMTAILTCKPLAAEIFAYLMRVHNSTVGHGGFNRTLRNLKKIGKVWEGKHTLNNARAAKRCLLTNKNPSPIVSQHQL